ncbi:MAG: hypothetical protein WDW36_007268 [Sanguina aurantia]
MGSRAGSSGAIETPTCITKPPSPPGNLTARPRDGRILLTWQEPGDGACLSTYIVRVFNGTTWKPTPLQVFSSGGSSTTSRRSINTTISGLTNGDSYLLTVQSYSAAFKGGATADVIASPTNKCASISPGKPVNVHVQRSGDTWAELCWDGVDNDACVDEFR